MYSLQLTHCFGSCLAGIIVIKAQTKKKPTTIATPTQLGEKNEIDWELATPRQSQGASAEPSPDNPRTLDAKDLIPDTHRYRGIYPTSFRHRRHLPRSSSPTPATDHSCNGAMRHYEGTTSWKDSTFAAVPFRPKP